MEKKFAENEALAIREILKKQLETCSGTEDQFKALKTYLPAIVEQKETEEMDPNYAGTFEELTAYVDERNTSQTLSEHVNLHQQNISRWLREIENYNTTEAVTIDKDQARKTGM